MTYSHALRYLWEVTPNAEDLPPLALSALHPPQGKGDALPLCISLTHDRQGSATARYLRAVLKEAGVPCLHWNTVAKDEKDCFLWNDERLSPPILCEHTQAVRSTEIALRRQSDEPCGPLSSPERCAAVALRCAIALGCRVLLIEGPSSISAPPVPAQLIRTLAHLPLLVVASSADEALHATLAAVSVGAQGVISAPCGESAYRRLSDACAKHDCRLSLLALPRLHREGVTLGSQSLSYRPLENASLLSGTKTAATAAALVAEAVLYLRSHGLAISDNALSCALSRTPLPLCCELLSIAPLVVADALTLASELSLIEQDLSQLPATLPHPRFAMIDPTLAADASTLRALFDGTVEIEENGSLTDCAALFLIGSPDFIQKARAKIEKK